MKKGELLGRGSRDAGECARWPGQKIDGAGSRREDSQDCAMLRCNWRQHFFLKSVDGDIL
jgi:hypothetical protein